ncbi:hypothetical protein CSIM01_01631 [Colletotrichum simmondsii]|uniref:Uncharacterized protein n=1 Tax=Colletotrichum simmondsii TaxID=703756 RepID=A0A135TRT6_9PEZI|nr:hypothetical protein CSIM01_01631 [Colletotrichum simmondsii]
MAWKIQNAKFSMEGWRGGYGSSHTLRAFLNHDTRPRLPTQRKLTDTPPNHGRHGLSVASSKDTLAALRVAKDGHIEISNSLHFRPHSQPTLPTLVSLRPTRVAVVSPSGPPSVTFGVLYVDYWQPGYLSSTCRNSTPPSFIFDSVHLACRRALASAAPDRQTIRQRLAHCSNCPPPLEPGCISGGTQDLSDERLAKQPGLSAAGDRDVGSGGWLDGNSRYPTPVPCGYNVFFNSSMYRTRLLESIKWPKQRSKEGNMFLSTQFHDSLHPLSMHACIPRRNSKKNSSTALSISWHTYWNVSLLFLLLMLYLDPTPPEPVIPPQANQNTADLPEPWSDQPFCSTLPQTIHIRSSLPDSLLGFPSVFVFDNAGLGLLPRKFRVSAPAGPISHADLVLGQIDPRPARLALPLATRQP